MAGGGVEEVFAELSSLPCEQPERRNICKRCRYAHHMYMYTDYVCMAVLLSQSPYLSPIT